MNFLGRNEWPQWLLLLAIFVEPFGRLVEVFVVIMAVVSIYDLAINHNEIRQFQGLKLFTIFFACFWVPALFSLPDAVNIKHSVSNVFGMLRFYLAGVFILSRIINYRSHIWFGIGLGFILFFWSIDGWIQYILGVDIFGLPPHSTYRISGVFGKDARLGLMIIPFLGASLVSIKEKLGINYLICFAITVISAVLISGDRAAWVSLFVAMLFWLILFKPNLNVARKNIIIGLAGIAIMIATVLNTPHFQNRLDSSLGGFDGSYESINTASSFRLPIWKTALKMFSDNPINGVGARGFRYAYPAYADSDDIFVDFSLPENKRSGPTQAHQIILEFLAETGIIGISGYIIALWLIFFKWRPLVVDKSAISVGYLVCLVAILFPINSHLSFFSSNWAQVVWMLVALCVSGLTCQRDLYQKSN